MHHQELTLKHKLYAINQDDLVLKEIRISGIQLRVMYDGRTEKPIFEGGHIEVLIRSGIESVLFPLDAEGNIIESHIILMADEQVAQEELIILKSKHWHSYA